MDTGGGVFIPVPSSQSRGGRFTCEIWLVNSTGEVELFQDEGDALLVS